MSMIGDTPGRDSIWLTLTNFCVILAGRQCQLRALGIQNIDLIHKPILFWYHCQHPYTSLQSSPSKNGIYASFQPPCTGRQWTPSEIALA